MGIKFLLKLKKACGTVRSWRSEHQIEFCARLENSEQISWNLEILEYDGEINLPLLVSGDKAVLDGVLDERRGALEVQF